MTIPPLQLSPLIPDRLIKHQKTTHLVDFLISFLSDVMEWWVKLDNIDDTTLCEGEFYLLSTCYSDYNFHLTWLTRTVVVLFQMEINELIKKKWMRYDEKQWFKDKMPILAYQSCVILKHTFMADKCCKNIMFIEFLWASIDGIIDCLFKI